MLVVAFWNLVELVVVEMTTGIEEGIVAVGLLVFR